MRRGIQIGNYVLAELLNTGGMGQVWLARRDFDGGGRTAVAIKFPHAAGVLDPRIREGLLDEARLQMRLQHPNIPRVSDMGVHEGLPYFVMDYIAGRSLAEVLARMRDVGTPLRFEIIGHIAREIGYALRYAHSFQIAGVGQQVIHRDVAPKNVLVSGQGGVYVIDFGVSEAVGVHSSRMHVKGTLLYMAPEHALGFPSPKSDGWGLGAILWEMIEGRQFRGDIDAEDLRRAANEGRHTPLSRSGVPDALRFVTEGLLRRDERDRLTLDEVLTPLETSEFPAQRTALCELMRRRFGGSVHRSGQTMHDFDMPEQLDRTIAAARVVKDVGPIELGPWDEATFTAAAAPPVVAVSRTRPVLRGMVRFEDARAPERVPRTERVPSSSSASIVEHVRPDAASSRLRDKTQPSIDVVQVAATGASASPKPDITEVTLVIAAPTSIGNAPSDPSGLTSSLVDGVSSEPQARPEPSRGSVVSGQIELDADIESNAPPMPVHDPIVRVHSTPKPSARAWLPHALVASLGLMAVSVLGAAQPWEGRDEAEPMPVDVALPTDATVLPAEEAFVDREPVGPVPASVVELERPIPMGPAHAPADEAEPSSDPRVPAEPPPTLEPQPPPAAEPTPRPARKKAAPKPRPPLPPSRITITFMTAGVMDIEIDGKRRSLTTRNFTSTLKIVPGSVVVRWRSAGGKWKMRRETIEPGLDYKVSLGHSGPKLIPTRRKAP